jgi:diguanylate cyclase (GGDEF)-like protein
MKWRYTLVILIFILFLISSFNNYLNTKDIVISEFNTQKRIVETNLKDIIKYANISAKVTEKTLNESMKKNSNYLVDLYRDNPNILDWNNEEIKDYIGDFDFYIIDENLEIINSSVEKDIGLNFSKYKAFSNLLRERMESGIFVTDRLDLSIKDKILRKYSYLGTYDKKYLIELSINIFEKYPEFKDMDIFSTIEKLKDDYNVVKNINIYRINEDGTDAGILQTTNKDIENYNTNINIDILSSIFEVVKTKKEVIHSIEEDKKVLREHKFIPIFNYNETEFDWWNSYIIELVYDEMKLNFKINDLKKRYVLDILVISVLFMFFSYMIYRLMERLESLAYTDHLTELPNRKMFEKKFEYYKKEIKRNRENMAILFLDLNNFKDINNNYGHEIGDKILKLVGQRLMHGFKEEDFVARLGGDEFIVILKNFDESNKDIMREKIKNMFKNPIKLKDKFFDISTSVGIAYYPEDGQTIKELLKKSDFDMYKDKNTNKDKQ